VITAQDLSLVHVIVGVRGGGKTLAMTHFICEALTRAYVITKATEKYGERVAYKYRKRKLNVWANYPVKFAWRPPLDGWKPVTLEVQKLDIERLLVWDKEYHDGIIFFDEIDQVADRQDWQSALSKMLTAGVQVLRHRNLTLVMTIQSIQWLNARLQWQADIITKCRDLAFTEWGREKGLDPGEVIRTVWISKSGVNTGYSFEETGQQYVMQFYGKRYWPCYQTTHEFDVAQLKTKYEIRVPKVTVDLAGDSEEEARDYDIVHEVIMEYGKSGNFRDVKSKEFWDKCEKHGMKASRSIMGRYLTELGVGQRVVRGLGRYNFEGLVE